MQCADVLDLVEPIAAGDLLPDERVREHLHSCSACAGALAVCQPSVNESFSIVLMESWLQETPALVNRRCAVTRHHVTLSNGGLYFDDPIEFAAEVDYLRRHPKERREMGRQGRAYVLDNYSWPVVLGRFEGALEEIFDSR